jgi:carbon monoxide dehydrogenase subunit G
VEVKLDKRYPVPVDATRAWQVLRDIEAVATCMPGAQITERVDANRYRGTVKTKVGPATASFGGEIEVIEIDADHRRIRLNARGADKGGSSASMNLTASLEPADGTRSVLVGSASVVVNGKFAQFGGRLMVQVSDAILAEFAANFAATAQARAGSPSSNAPVKARQLNALAIAWNVVKSWFTGLFSRHA